MISAARHNFHESADERNSLLRAPCLCVLLAERA